MKIPGFGRHVGGSSHNSQRHRSESVRLPPVPTVRVASGTVCVYATLASDEELGTVEQLGEEFLVAFAGEDQQPFRFHTMQAALDYFAEFAWCRHLGALDP